MARKTRKELLKKDDAFIKSAKQSAQWAQSNRFAVVAGSVALVVVVLGLWLTVEHIRQRDERASVLLEEALDLSGASIVDETDDLKADPRGDPPTFASEDDRRRALLQKYAEVEQIAGGGIGSLAQFYIAGLHEQLKDLEAAEKSFAGLANELSTNDSLYFLAIERTAYLQEARGDRQAAISTLSRLAGAVGLFYADYATLHQARLYLAEGDEVTARNLLERLEREYPDSGVVKDVRSQLAMIGRSPETDDTNDVPSKDP